MMTETGRHTILLALIAVITISLCRGQAADACRGRLLSDDWGADATNDLSGSVYAVNEESFQIISFTFDGLAENSVFLLGTNVSYYQAKQLYIDIQDPEAIVLTNQTGVDEPLQDYTGEDIFLALPDGITYSDITYIAVYSRNESMFIGGFDVPSDFVAPVSIGPFTGRGHDVSSGDVTVIDDRTICIEKLTYDGEGPDAFFYIGVTDSVTLQSSPFGKIPDENGIIEQKAQEYSNQDIALTLPAGISVTELKWLSIYCIQYNVNFGEVRFPDDLNVPPFIGSNEPAQPKRQNCERFSNGDRVLQVSWTVQDNVIEFELAGNIDQTTDYMAFGLSGSDSELAMIEADVVVADWTGENPKAIDYYLTAYSQCASNGGACPDTDQSNGGIDNIEMPTGELTNGITRIKYKRLLVTGDSNDKEYKTDGTAQQIVWAIGPINTKGEAAKHYSDGRITNSKAINFGREAEDNCEPME